MTYYELWDLETRNLLDDGEDAAAIFQYALDIIGLNPGIEQELAIGEYDTPDGDTFITKYQGDALIARAKQVVGMQEIVRISEEAGLYNVTDNPLIKEEGEA